MALKSALYYNKRASRYVIRLMKDRKWAQRTGIFVGMWLMLLTGWTRLSAQTFYNLTAQQVRLGETLPVFTHREQLGPNYADSVYTVEIAYPEFIDMREADIQRYQQLSGEPLPAMPVVKQTVGVVRKQGVLDVEFVPLVYRDGRYQKLVSFMLKVERRAKSRWAATRGEGDGERYRDHSVLNEGIWVKIRVPETGFYQLTEALVKKAGFTDINRVRIYGYGGALQPECLTGDYLKATDDLQEVPTCMVGGKRIFHAVGPVTWEKPDTLVRTRNPYSDDGYYFLTAGEQEPLTVSEEVLTAASYPLPEDYHSLYEVDDYAWYHGGRNLFDKQLFTIGTPRTFTLAGKGETGAVAIALTADGNYEAQVEVNDSLVGTIRQSVTLDSYSKAQENVFEYVLDGLVKPENTIRITQTSGANLRLDYIALQHDTPKDKPDFQTATLPEPEYVYHITNQDHHADGAVDMVIIIPTTQKWLAQAERIKSLHEGRDGLSVRIVPADELYNEFSSGTPDATAYRRYMKMLYDRAATEAEMPKYLLLYGDGAWDNRMRCEEWNGYDPDDYLLCFESDNSFSSVSCYVSDDFFCLLDDEERIQEPSGRGSAYLGKPDVAVGRFPVRTLESATVLADKTIGYAGNEHAGAWQNTICFMGDDGNNNTHMQTADKVATLVETNYPGYQLKKIYWDAYTRTSSSTGYSYPDVTRLIKQQMESGALMMNYSGHGAPYAFSHELVMKLADFEAASSMKLPLWVTASCDIMPFDGQEDNIGETVMLNSQGGGVAFFGTTRTVYATYNESMNLAFTGYVLTPGISIGEAVRRAKCDLVTSGSDTSPNKLQYTLLGDPALRLACPEPEVVVDSICPISGGLPSEEVTEAQQLSAGSVVRVYGHVEQQQALASGFNGVLTATVRDAEEIITCKLNDDSADGADTPFVYKDRTKTLYQGSDSIVGGRFGFTFAVPKDISYAEGNGLMTLYAINNEQTQTLHGQNDGFVLNGSEVVENDSIGPSIYCYLNAKTFTNGDQVNATPYFMAELYDESGINASGSSIGHDLELVIDNDRAKTYNLNSYYTYDFGDYRSGKVGFSIPQLNEGQHRLLFRAWDVMNNSSVAELVFNVVSDLDAGGFSVACTKNPASETTSFVMTHDRVGSSLTVTMDVFDLSGRQLWKHTETGTPSGSTYTMSWDLRIDGGSRLQTGVYLCRFQLDGGSSKTVKLIVLGNN